MYREEGGQVYPRPRKSFPRVLSHTPRWRETEGGGVDRRPDPRGCTHKENKNPTTNSSFHQKSWSTLTVTLRDPTSFHPPQERVPRESLRGTDPKKRENPVSPFHPPPNSPRGPPTLAVTLPVPSPRRQDFPHTPPHLDKEGP